MSIKNLVIAGIILLSAINVFAGDIEVLSSDRYRTVYGLIPDCDSNETDTLGTIDLLGGKNFSIGFSGTLLNHDDTAMVDSSGVILRFYTNHLDASTNISTPNTADSLPDIFGTGVLGNRATNMSKSVSMDATRFLIPVINRIDSGITLGKKLDFKNSAGTVNKNVLTFTVIKEVY